MDEDIIIAIIEIYKAGDIIERKAVFGEVQKSFPHLTYADYSTIVDELHNKDILIHEGTHRNHYIYNDSNRYLDRYKERQAARNKKKTLDDKTESRKAWKERNWVLVQIIESSVSNFISLIIGIVLGGIGGYLIGTNTKEKIFPKELQPPTQSPARSILPQPKPTAPHNVDTVN